MSTDKDKDVQPAEEEKLDKSEHYKRLVHQWKTRQRRRTAPHGNTIRFKSFLRNTILDVLRDRGYRETESETSWDFYWANREWIRAVYDRIHLDSHQRVNHYRNYYELTRKDTMVKNLKRAMRALQKKGLHEEAQKYAFFPQTFALPGEYRLFVAAFRANPNSNWIMKPIGRCQGKGIFLFEKLSQISEWKNDQRWTPDSPQAERYIVQQYVSNPLLVGGKKFDLRLYALVTSYQPLTVYVHREGFCRFTSTRFSMDSKGMNNNYVHLTNVAVQKKGEHYDADSGGKWHVRLLKLYLIHRYGRERVNRLFYDIQMMMVRSLLAVQTVMISDKNSFELYGYDVLVDDELRPWLIEINASPSLTANTQSDYNLKYDMLQDMLSVVDMEGRLNGNEEQVGGFDLVYRGGYIQFDPNCTFTTYVGCLNNRQAQLRKLKKHLRKKKANNSAAPNTAKSK